MTRETATFLRVAVAAAAALGGTRGLAAQAAASAGPGAGGGLHGLVLYDRVNPIPGGGSAGEVRLIHPVAMAHATALDGRLRFTGMLNFEGLTIADGQLAPGVWGEGYVDRRHPHTYLHEAVLTWRDRIPLGGRGLAVSLSAGKGFAPFGSDDPMSRPVIRYPVNHHLAQVLERLVGILALRTGPVLLEGALFNGDEPDSPGQWPNAGRFGDSWAARLTIFPVDGLELQGSLATIASPEFRPGGALGHDKWSVSARVERQAGAQRFYGLAEYARGDEGDGAFSFSSFLAEAAWGTGPHQLHYRFERTARPEEQRLNDLWRTPRPHHDFSVLGSSRWAIHTLGYAFEVPGFHGIRLTPVIEGSLGRVTSLTPASFDPDMLYGRDAFWTLSAGVRVGWGARLHRMGRYGAAEAPAGAAPQPGADHAH